MRPRRSSTYVDAGVWPIVTDGVAWSVRPSVCLSVGLSRCMVSRAKTALPIKMSFGMWTRVGPRKMGVHIDATWGIRLNRPCAAVMRPDVQLLWPLACVKVARWCNGKAFVLAISRSRVQILLQATLRNNLRQVVYTYVPLSPSSITWDRPKGGDALRLGR